MEKIIINDITFFYDKEKINIEEYMQDIKEVASDADDKAYTVCLLEGELVIY